MGYPDFCIRKECLDNALQKHGKTLRRGLRGTIGSPPSKKLILK